MIRFVVGPGPVLVPDIAAKLPGRGIWLSAEGDVIETARVQGALARAVGRAAGVPVPIPADLREQLEAGLERRIAEFLGFARRAGQAVAGCEKVHDWLVRGRVGLLLHAEDGSGDEPGRFSIASPAAAAVGVSAAALGRVFGRACVAHVALQPGRLAETVRIDLGRLAGLRRGWTKNERASA